MAARIALLLGFLLAVQARGAERLQVEPESITLRGPAARQQLLATHASEQDLTDITDDADYRSSNPDVATVSPTGVVRAVTDGQADITVSRGDLQASVRVTVSGANEPAPIHFRNDILTVLSKAGCNAGSCHGKQGGQTVSPCRSSDLIRRPTTTRSSAKGEGDACSPLLPPARCC